MATDREWIYVAARACACRIPQGRGHTGPEWRENELVLAGRLACA